MFEGSGKNFLSEFNLLQREEIVIKKAKIDNTKKGNYVKIIPLAKVHLNNPWGLKKREQQMSQKSGGLKGKVGFK